MALLEPIFATFPIPQDGSAPWHLDDESLQALQMTHISGGGVWIEYKNDNGHHFRTQVEMHEECLSIVSCVRDGSELDKAVNAFVQLCVDDQPRFEMPRFFADESVTALGFDMVYVIRTSHPKQHDITFGRLPSGAYLVLREVERVWFGFDPPKHAAEEALSCHLQLLAMTEGKLGKPLAHFSTAAVDAPHGLALSSLGSECSLVLIDRCAPKRGSHDDKRQIVLGRTALADGTICALVARPVRALPTPFMDMLVLMRTHALVAVAVVQDRDRLHLD